MTYIAAQDLSDGIAKVIYQSKDDKTTKTFEALDWLAQLVSHKFDIGGIHLTGLAYVVGWVKRVPSTYIIGFASPITPQWFEIATKSANPTRFVASAST